MTLKERRCNHSSIHPPTHPSIHLFTHANAPPSIHPPTHPSTHPPIHPFIHLFTHPPMQKHLHPSIHPSTHPRTRTSTVMRPSLLMPSPATALHCIGTDGVGCVGQSSSCWRAANPAAANANTDRTPRPHNPQVYKFFRDSPAGSVPHAHIYPHNSSSATCQHPPIHPHNPPTHARTLLRQGYFSAPPAPAPLRVKEVGLREDEGPVDAPGADGGGAHLVLRLVCVCGGGYVCVRCV